MEEDSKRLQFKYLILKKVSPHPKIPCQLNQQDINHFYNTISVTMASGFKKMPVTDFLS